MTNFRPYFGIAVIASVAILVVHSSRAEEQSENPSRDAATRLSLLDRIEMLEKRIAKLEEETPLVRQADSRESPDLGFPGGFPFLLLPVQPAPQPYLTNPNDEEQTEKSRRPKGRIYLLGHRSHNSETR